MTVIHKIGTNSAAGRDFSTMQSWEDALPVTLTEPYVAELYNDSQFNAGGGFADAVTISGTTTSATNTVTVRAAAGQGYKDHADAATNRFAFVPAYGVSIMGGIGGTIQNLILDGLQVRASGDNTYLGGFSNYTVTNCIFYWGGSTNNVNRSGTGTASNGTHINCLFVNFAGTLGNLTYVTGSNVYIGCTAITPSNITPSNTRGLSAIYGTGTAFNCAIFGFNFPFVGGWTNAALIKNCASNYQIPGGDASNKGLRAYDATVFVNANASSNLEDFRIKNNLSVLYGAGAVVSGYAADAFGRSRTGLTDIGPAEYVGTLVSAPLFGAAYCGAIATGRLLTAADTGVRPAIQSTPTPNDVWNGTQGFDFKVIAPITVTQLGIYDDSGDGIASTNATIAIYDRTADAKVSGTTLAFASGSLEAGTTVIGSFRYKTLPTPVVLQPGLYWLAAYIPLDTYPYNAGSTPGEIFTSSANVIFNDLGTLNRYNSGAPLATAAGGTEAYFANTGNMIFVETAVAASAALSAAAVSAATATGALSSAGAVGTSLTAAATCAATAAGNILGPGGTWGSAVAGEGGSYDLGAVYAYVRYGAAPNYAYKYATGVVGFNNSTFGDPYPGIGKSGWVWTYDGGSQALTGAATAQATATAAPSIRSALTASASAVATATSALTSGMLLTAAAQAVASTTGALAAQAIMAASAAAQATATGAARGNVLLAAAASNAATAGAALTLSGGLTAAAQAQATATASLSAKAALAGAAAAQATAGAALSQGMALLASASTVASAGAALSVSAAFAAGAQAQATAGATIQLNGGFNGNAQAQAAATANLTARVPLVAAAAAQADAVGTLLPNVALTAAASAVATANGATTALSQALTGAAQAVASAAASTQAGVALAAAPAAQASAAGNLLAAVALAASVASAATAGATLSIGGAWNAGATSASTATAQLSTFTTLAASPAASSQGTAALLAQARLAASASAQATATQQFAPNVALLGAAGAAASATGGMQGQITLAATAAGRASVVAVVGTRVALVAGALIVCDATARLYVPFIRSVERTLTIVGELRRMAVAGENRRIAVGQENRQTVVASEGRTFTIRDTA